ncbi:uncharacterized protein LOC128735107 [Sabethes cyaneus]|uniref:uncharacterized protein LOC128735107 n=1 Tax=Sabethes cyaneus TaxID=53552 RepID=UPI00237DE105|nr:uncharacterized protein LOC128735107 [Sabethes cyaneus]
MDPVTNSTLRLDDFLHCCRLCFDRSSTLVDVFKTPDSPAALAKIEKCLEIVITQDDFPATSICQRCFMFIEQFYNYRQICQRYHQMFHDSIKTNRVPDVDAVPASSLDDVPTAVHIKSEPLEISDRIEQEPLDIDLDIIKEEPVYESPAHDKLPMVQINTVKSELTVEPSETSDDSGATPVKRGRRMKKIHREGLTVRMIIDKMRMNCTKVCANGSMQFSCDNSDCPFLYNGLPDGTFVPRSSKPHNHRPHMERVGLIHVLNTGRMEQFAVDSKPDVGDAIKLVWNDHEWTLAPDGRLAVCTKQGMGRRSGSTCPRYVKIHGDYHQLEECGGEHDHQKHYFVIRASEKLTEFDVNLWELFCRIDPCRLSVSQEMQLPIRVKLFYQGSQFRIAECSWGGTSRWRCDTVNCRAVLCMNEQGLNNEKNHSHDPPIERQGVFNGIYYCVMSTNIGLKRIFYNAHSFGSRSSGKWLCAVPGCNARLFVGENYESFVMKGKHGHEGFSAIIKPVKGEAIHLTPENPTLPPSVSIDALLEEMPTRSDLKIPRMPAPQPKPLPKPKPKQQSTSSDSKKHSLLEETESNSVVRMAYDGHRYTLCEFFGDGTSFWRCWGVRCKKSLHMSSNGFLYAKNDSIEHEHPPSVSKLGRVTLDDGRCESFAVFQDCRNNTSLMYRNTLWDLVRGEGVYIASCKDFQITDKDQLPCSAKIRISLDYTKFEHTGECIDHSEKYMLIRSASKSVEGDPLIWKLYQQKHPLYLNDGSLFTGGRNSHLFIGDQRYTLQSLLWNGCSVWRCSLQFCTAKGRISSKGYFQTAEHKHDKLNRIQGFIWNEKRQKEERYIVSITVKKTLATMYYNTYCYALRDTRNNIWSCYPGLCNASLRVEGDFQRVVDEIEHTHDGTLTFVRKDETPESQETTPPTKGTSRKRVLESTDVSECKPTAKRPRIKQEPIVLSESRPKLESVLELLQKRTVKVNEKSPAKPDPILRYHGGFTYYRCHTRSNGSMRLECKKFRCPGVIVVSADQQILSKTEHTHSKNFDTCGTISDMVTGETMPYILVNGTQKRHVTYFVCNGYRYHILSKIQNLNAESEWQCGKCDVKITITNSFSHIEFGSAHEHEPTDLIIPDSQEEESVPSDFGQGTVHLDEVVWGNHRYTLPIFIRRLNRIKWMCYKRRECRGYIYQLGDGSFEDMEPHNHDGPVETLGEAGYDEFLKVKDRFAILKPGERPKVRQLIFQNYMYNESTESWKCNRKSCNGAIQSNADFSFLRVLEGHCHQPTITSIKFLEEIQPFLPLYPL